MVYTVTFNPSLDYFISLHGFEWGKTNRTKEEQILPGGKGINVSTVLQNLGIANTALGFTAGFTGDEIERRTGTLGVHCDFIRLKEGCSRINIKWKDFEGTEINGMGPEIQMQDLELLLKKLDHLRKGDVLILAGSIPANSSHLLYRDLLDRLQGKGILFAVDASGASLFHVLEYHPFLMKPNRQELGELFHRDLKTKEEVVFYGEKLREMGARNVLVSMAGEGAVLLAENGQVLMLSAPRGKLVNPVGAGDSMVAGFLAGWLEKQDYSHAFLMGVAAGSASAFSPFLATREEILAVYRTLEINS